MKNRFFEDYVSLVSDELMYDKIDYNDIYMTYLGYIDDRENEIKSVPSFVNKLNNSEKKFLKKFTESTIKIVVDDKINNKAVLYHTERLIGSKEALIWISRYFRTEFNPKIIKSIKYHNLSLFNDTILKILLAY